jgi:hypothetical protein
LRVGAVRLVWVVLALLAAFVIFIQCMAEVGGEAIPKPTGPVAPVATAPAQ